MIHTLDEIADNCYVYQFQGLPAISCYMLAKDLPVVAPLLRTAGWRMNHDYYTESKNAYVRLDIYHTGSYLYGV